MAVPNEKTGQVAVTLPGFWKARCKLGVGAYAFAEPASSRCANDNKRL
jgi:hypothetical protein